MINPGDVIAVLAMMMGAGGSPPHDAGIANLVDAPAPSAARERPATGGSWISFDAVARIPTQHQVRIEQRVIIRIVPRSIAQRQAMSAFAPVAPQRTRLVEREAGDCLPVSAIGAVQPGSGNRLMLFLRDRRLFSARLEKSCSARDFYSGFYVERNEDGKICVDRDRLQSRSGAKCQLETLRQLVAVGD